MAISKHSVLIDAWREAGRHSDIREAAMAIARLLARHLPLAYLLVRRLDVVHQTLETIAVGGASEVLRHPLTRTELSHLKLRRLKAWGREPVVLQGKLPGSEELASVVPSEVVGEVIVGPLRIGDQLGGIIVLVADPRKSFRPQHVELAAALLDPLSAVLENDRRLHELAALREAAEADR